MACSYSCRCSKLRACSKASCVAGSMLAEVVSGVVDSARGGGAWLAQPRVTSDTARAASSAPLLSQAGAGVVVLMQRIDKTVASLGFGITHRHQFCQCCKALTDPIVIQALGRAISIQGVQLNGFFFERQCFVFEQGFIFGERFSSQSARSLGSQQGLGEIGIEVGDGIAGLGGDGSDLVGSGPLISGLRFLEAGFLVPQAFLQRLI